jgi:Carbohydrate family 9 binding domain-like
MLALFAGATLGAGGLAWSCTYGVPPVVAVGRDDASQDAITPVSRDAASEDSTTRREASGDCGSPSASPLSVMRAPGLITVDGVLDEWPCDAFVTLNASTGVLRILQDGGAPPAGQFAVLWDEGHLYFAARVFEPNFAEAPGYNATIPWQNDAVEVYVALDEAGDAMGSGDYTAQDHQFIVDWKNLALDYQYRLFDGGLGTLDPSFVSATSPDADGGVFTVEVAMSASAIGAPELTAGTRLPFDFAFDEGNGDQLCQVVWAVEKPAVCTCERCCCGDASPVTPLPYCDTLCFGTAILSP